MHMSSNKVRLRTLAVEPELLTAAAVMRWFYKLKIGSLIVKAGFILPYCDLHFLPFIIGVDHVCISKVFVHS